MGGKGRWISEFEASLVYRLSSRTARTTQRSPVLKKKEAKETLGLDWRAMWELCLVGLTEEKGFTNGNRLSWRILKSDRCKKVKVSC